MMDRLTCITAIACLAACQEGELESSRTLPLGSAPTVRIATQNAFYTHNLTCGAQGGVSSVSGFVFLQENCCDLGEPGCTTPCGTVSSPTYTTFIAQTQADVECRIGLFLRSNAATYGAVTRPAGSCPSCPANCYSAPNVTGTIILDIEKPHLKNLWQYRDVAGADHTPELINAYRTRIRAARAAFPRAKLGVYGTLNPDELGDPNDTTFVQRKAALVAAGAAHLYDDLDYLVPVVYPRFGCDRESATTCPDCDPKWIVDGDLTLRSYTELGVTASRDLAPGKPLLPLLTVRVANGTSCFQDRLLLDLFPSVTPATRFDKTLQVQLDVLQAQGVAEAALWVGPDANLLPDPNPTGWRVGNYTNQLCN